MIREEKTESTSAINVANWRVSAKFKLQINNNIFTIVILSIKTMKSISYLLMRVAHFIINVMFRLTYRIQVYIHLYAIKSFFKFYSVRVA